VSVTASQVMGSCGNIRLSLFVIYDADTGYGFLRDLASDVRIKFGATGNNWMRGTFPLNLRTIITQKCEAVPRRARIQG